MTTTNLGRVAVVPKGDWAAGTYKALDLVRYNNASYIAKGATSALPTDTTAWTLIVNDGNSLYTWVKYATDAIGTGLTDNPAGMSFIGIAVNKTSATESTVAADYTWSSFVGSGSPSGGGLLPTGIKTAAYTAAKNELVRCNTTAGAFSVSMPSTPTDGDIVGVVDIYNTFTANKLTVLPNGGTIEGDSTSLILDISGASVSFVYNQATTNWRLLETPTVAASNPAGTVTSVAAPTITTTGTDITASVVTSTSTPVITINVPSASATARGVLTAADWSTFNSKQAALVSGTNVKTVNGNSILGSGDLTIAGGVTSVAALTIGDTGTDITSSVATSTSTPVITINVPSASATNRGVLTTADWTTFNTKQAALVSGTNIKTVNGTSLLGSGDITITGGGGGVTSVGLTVPSFLSVTGSPVTASGTLAVTLSGTALPVANGGTGITSFGTGIATFLGSPTSSNLLAAINDETGTGSVVFNTAPVLKGTKETGIGVSGVSNVFTISCTEANYFSITPTAASTIAVSNSASGVLDVNSFVLDLTNGGAFAITWWGIKWVGGTAPTLTAAGRDTLVFFRAGSNNVWNGFVVGKDLK